MYFFLSNWRPKIFRPHLGHVPHLADEVLQEDEVTKELLDALLDQELEGDIFDKEDNNKHVILRK